jgi:hypothetical protein
MTTLWIRRLALFTLAAAVATGCSKKDSADRENRDEDERSSESDTDTGMPGAKEINEAADNFKKAAPFVGKELGDAMQAMGKVMEKSENVTITAVDFRVLRELLPETAGSLKRKSREGQKQMGMSEATAEYGDEEGNASIHAKITDSGQMRGMMAGAAAYTMSLDMDKETEDGFERNITFQGYRAHEKKSGDSTELTTLVGDRFIVELNGYNVKPEQLKAVMEAIPLKKLEALKDEGVEKAAK